MEASRLVHIDASLDEALTDVVPLSSEISVASIGVGYPSSLTILLIQTQGMIQFYRSLKSGS